MSYVPRLSEDYRKNVIPHLMKKFSYKNVNQVPKLVKIVVNMGVGEANENPKLLESAIEDLKLIVGQKPITTRARKAISNFKLRAGTAIGCAVTLRRDRMYEFLDRLISMAIPRVRDFRGLSPTSFDGRGNYNLGLKEQIIFPEIDYDKVDKVRGLNITIVTTAKSNEEAYELLASIGLPFRKKS
ncbi:50S ribosomal protein L5 [candidate division KSB1 bacterium]|nr:50S ribosomal protein L5 [candidate division KSB1 bacterium]